MKTIKGIIFDFNGTLLWDTPYHNKAWNIFLKNYGITLTDQEVHDNMHGKTNGEIFPYLFKRAISGEELIKLSGEKEKIYRDLILADNFQMADGVEQMFNTCLGASVPMAIATSSDKENAMFYYERYNLKKWFMKMRFVYNDYTFGSKPQPDIFIKTASRMFLDPEEIMVFEDSPAGIEAAERFGAGRIIIVNSTHSDYSAYSYERISSFNDAMRAIKRYIIDPRNINL